MAILLCQPWLTRRQAQRGHDETFGARQALALEELQSRPQYSRREQVKIGLVHFQGTELEALGTVEHIVVLPAP
ncbi:MAG: hypothetical protein U0931_13460 [Vulcanimicrobiota bacterium]